LCGDDVDCPVGYRCIGSLVCEVGETAAAHYCAQACSDVTAAGAGACGASFKCEVGCAPDGPVMMCDPAGVQTAGPCQYATDCAAGYGCVSGLCRQACHTSA